MSRTALLLIGHGTPRHRGSADATRDQARRLAGSGFAAVAAAFLEEPPLPACAIAALPGEQAVAVGLFLDNGPHGDEDVRDALAPVGRPVACTGAIGADPALVPLILDQAAAVSPR
jgi:sirohydrochlorin ferrochelatase